jgi:hypothetical protein
MALWLRLENAEGDAIHINMDLAVSVRRVENMTRIVFPSPGADRLIIVVKEDPEYIFHQIRNLSGGSLMAQRKTGVS